MRVNEGVAPPTSPAVAVLEALLDVFAPLDVVAGDARIARLDPVRAFGTTPLWCDEELTRGALTRCGPALGTDVVAELYARDLGRAPIVARGAVRLVDGWFGRWCNGELHDVLEVQVAADGVAFALPLRGYPLTAVRPLARRLDRGDPAVAAAHRRHWLPALCRVRAAFGLDREEVTWETTLGRDFQRALAAS